jgi:hypothetical protein
MRQMLLPGNIRRAGAFTASGYPTRGGSLKRFAVAAGRPRNQRVRHRPAGLRLHADLVGFQEVPSVSTSARGFDAEPRATSSRRLHPDLWASSAAAAHIHRARGTPDRDPLCGTTNLSRPGRHAGLPAIGQRARHITSANVLASRDAAARRRRPRAHHLRAARRRRLPNVHTANSPAGRSADRFLVNQSGSTSELEPDRQLHSLQALVPLTPSMV